MMITCDFWLLKGWVYQTYIFLVRVEKPEGEITGLGGCGKVTQRLSITSQQKPALIKENTSSGTAQMYFNCF